MPTHTQCHLRNIPENWFSTCFIKSKIMLEDTDVLMNSGERRKFIQFRVVTRSWDLWEVTKGEEDRRVGAPLTGNQCRAWLKPIHFKLIHVFLTLRYKWFCSKRRKISFTLKKQNPNHHRRRKKACMLNFYSIDNN